MPIILNLTTCEYFIANNAEEQMYYLQKLLNHKPPTETLDWKWHSTFTVFKSVIRWNRTDKIVTVPSTAENHVFTYKNKYHLISINNYSEEVLV
jgi:hypothetical protein